MISLLNSENCLGQNSELNNSANPSHITFNLEAGRGGSRAAAAGRRTDAAGRGGEGCGETGGEGCGKTEKVEAPWRQSV